MSVRHSFPKLLILVVVYVFGEKKMVKSTIQVLLEPKDLEFLSTLIGKHKLKNNSDAIRTMIARYKGMEDWILKRREIEEKAKEMREAKVIVY
jgi:Arc/MetJ-type ribon-helix-helix transcriptional regulator